MVGQILSCNFRILVHCTLPQILSAVCCSGREWCFSENTFRLAMRARDSAFSTLTIINSEVLVLRYPDIKYAKNPRSAIMAFALYFLPPTLPGPSSRCSVLRISSTTPSGHAETATHFSLRCGYYNQNTNSQLARARPSHSSPTRPRH